MLATLQFLAGVLGTVLMLLAVLRKSNDEKAHYIVSYGVYFLATLMTSIATFPLFLCQPRNTKNPRIASVIFNVCTRFMDVDWTLKNVHSIKKDQAAVIVSNHQSIFDVVGLSLLLEHLGDCTVVLKRQILYIPGVGFWAWMMGLVFIDRKNPKRALRDIEKTSYLLEREKAKLWIFPEGTRGEGKSLLPFKKGAFVMAIRTQKPIIPIVYSPYRSITDFKYTTPPEGRRMIVSVLDEIPTVGLTEADVPSLMAKTRKVIETEFEKLKTEVATPDSAERSNGTSKKI